MNLKKQTIENRLDVRIILAALWIAGMLGSLNGDTYRLHDPVMLAASLESTAAIKVTPELLFFMSLVFVIPICMSILTLTLSYQASRLANRIIGTIYAPIIVSFLVMGLVMKSNYYELVWSTAQSVFAILVVLYAWRWPQQEAGLNAN